MVACFLLDRPISGQKFKAFAAVQHSKNKLPFSPLNCAQRVHKLMVPERTLPHTPSRVAHQIVAARTESSDLPLGTAIPEFEVRLLCNSAG